jgi:hypothetical protein
MPTDNLPSLLAQSGQQASIRYDLFSFDLDVIYYVLGLAVLLLVALLAILVTVLIYRKTTTEITRAR